MLVDSPVCNFGWKLPNFELKDPSGNLFSSLGSIGENGLLIAFICNHCPYVKAIAERLSSDIDKLKNMKVNTLLIMSNDYHQYPDDSPANMLEFALRHKISAPYLIDEDQSMARSFGAVCTPDFFGFNRDGELQYRGRLDDAAMGDAQSRNPELLNAMQLVIDTGSGPQKQTPSMGCSIKWR